jgi:hydrogenase-4 component B
MDDASGLALLVAAGALLCLSGAPGLLLHWRSPWGERVATAATVAAALLGALGAITVLAGAAPASLTSASSVAGIRLSLGADALSAFFALPVFVVGALGSIYGLAYWPARRRPRNGRRLRFCYGLLLGSMVFVTLARDAGSFLVAWEVMAICGFFAVTTESESPEVRQAGWLYLLYSHAGILAIAGFFAILAHGNGDFSLRPLAEGGIAPGFAAAGLALAILGFGAKAGVMPLHSWLPSAHASAPSHVSAVMSGVLLKMGVYGLLRATSMLPLVSSAAAIVLALGALSALLAIVFALAQRDLKRLLAYSSIENVGILLLGLGVAMVGRSTGRAEWVVLGMAGCLLHVWNHALFKSLLFLGAGSVVHATGSRDLERMGGLARRMPATAALYLVGAIAICGLPPGNGFVSELLVYLGLARAAVEPGAAWVALPAPVLAASGALALVCFVKVLGVVFLGSPRSEAAGAAHEAPAGMLAPLAALAGLCALLGAAPALVAPALERATAVWAGAPLAARPLAALVPFGWISTAALALAGAVALLLLLLRPACRRARARAPELETWDCGYAAASPRLQYTGSSFAEVVAARFAWALRPRERRPVIEGHFPQAASFHSQVDDTVLVRILEPRAEQLRRFAARVRTFQQGNLQEYVLYVLAAILVLLLFNLRIETLFRQLFSW